MTRQSRAMPVGVLRSERPQLRQIIACERAALEADRFHWPEVLCDPAPGVQPEMSNLQAQAFGLNFQVRSSTFQVPSSKFEVRSSKFNVPSSKFRVPSSKFEVQRSTAVVRLSLLREHWQTCLVQ